MQALLTEARRLRVMVHQAKLPPPRRGYYAPDHNLIVITQGLTLPQRRETLAHELGHAYYGHDCTSDRTEEQAWRRAALLTVDVNRYRIAEQLNPHPAAIALELDLTTRLITTWQSICSERERRSA